MRPTHHLLSFTANFPENINTKTQEEIHKVQLFQKGYPPSNQEIIPFYFELSPYCLIHSTEKTTFVFYAKTVDSGSKDA